MNGEVSHGEAPLPDSAPFGDQVSAALQYAACGTPVIPLHTPGPNGLCTCGKFPCENAGKHPRTSNGILDATTDPKIIKAWWTRWPNANVGIATGSVSGILVLDVDPKNGGADSLNVLEKEHPPGLPDTRMHQTGSGGFHILLKHPPGIVIKNTSGKLAPGLDIKTDGGYIVAPPSTHTSGRAYTIARNDILADPPGWLLSLIAEGGNGSGEKSAVPDIIPEGGRNITLTRIAGSLRRPGLKENEIFAALIAVNQARCHPPLDESEVRTIARSAATWKSSSILEEFKRGIDEKDRPEIVITDRPLRDISYEAVVTMVMINNPPSIFRRLGELVRIQTDEKEIPKAVPLTEPGVRGILARAANFFKIAPKKIRDEKTGEMQTVFRKHHIAPPREIVQDIMSLPTLPVPALLGVTTTPIINPDGRIHAEKGYDPDSRLYYYPPPGTTIPPVSENPIEEDVKKAASIILEPFAEFPFVDDTSRTHCIASMLTAVLRPLIDGSVPMAIIDKPMPGTGASLIGELIGIILFGASAAVTPSPKKEEEWGKQITTSLLGGNTLMIIDNVEDKIYSSSLAIVLTASYWRQRLLGTNTEVEIPIRMVVIANGNNVSLGGDLPRRVYWCRMDPNCPRPWQRDIEYKHPDIRAWTLEKRGEILWGVLTLAKSWILAGRPVPGPDVPKLGGYESWRHVVGGVLSHGNFEGFLGNLEDLYESMDIDGTQWDAFISCWFAKWGDKPIFVSNLIEQINAEHMATDPRYADPLPISTHLPDDLADVFAKGKYTSRRFGRELGKRKDRIFSSGLKLVVGPAEHKTGTWRVIDPKTQRRIFGKNETITLGGTGGTGGIKTLTPLYEKNMIGNCTYVQGIENVPPVPLVPPKHTPPEIRIHNAQNNNQEILQGDDMQSISRSHSSVVETGDPNPPKPPSINETPITSGVHTREEIVSSLRKVGMTTTPSTWRESAYDYICLACRAPSHRPGERKKKGKNKDGTDRYVVTREPISGESFWIGTDEAGKSVGPLCHRCKDTLMDGST